MKRLVTIIAAIAAAAMAFTACNPKEEPVKVKTEITGFNDFAIPADGGSQTFTVLGAEAWTISKSGLDWLSVSPVSGKAEEKVTVTISADKNTGENREGTLTLYVGSETKTAKVSQAAKASLAVSGAADNKVSFGFEAEETYTLKVVANVAWTATADSWLTLSPASGNTGETTVTVKAAANTGAARSGKITFSGTGVDNVVIAASQDEYKEKGYLTLDESTPGPGTLPAASAEPFIIKFRTNTEWSIAVKDSWVTASAASGQPVPEGTSVTFTAADNENAEPRSTTITISSSDATVPAVTVTVTQEGKPEVGGDVILAKWTLTDNQLNTVNGATWPGTSETAGLGLAKADPEYPGAQFQYHTTTDNVITFLISSDTFGQYAFKPTTPGDYIEFTVPVKEAPAGTKFALKITLQGTARAARYHTFTYLDGTDWKLTSADLMPAEEVSDAVKEAVGEANVILKEYNKAIDFNEVFSISNPIKNGELKIRFTAKGGTSKSYTIGQSSGMSSSSTIRMRYPSTIEDTDNTNPDRAISVWQLAE